MSWIHVFYDHYFQFCIKINNQIYLINFNIFLRGKMQGNLTWIHIKEKKS